MTPSRHRTAGAGSRRRPVRQALPGAHPGHHGPDRRPADVRLPRELVAHGAGHRHVDRHRARARRGCSSASWPHLASAYISGISVGMLVRSPEFWPYALCAAISITSKYVLRVDGRHLWNPSNFGIVAMLVLAPDTVASLSVQWGNNLLPMVVVWCFGSVIIHSARPLPHHADLRRSRSWSSRSCARWSPATRCWPRPRRSPGRCISSSSSS